MTNQRPGNKSRGISDDVIGHIALLFIFLKMAIVLHDKFDSWQEFQDKLDAYCKETYQSFVKDDSRTVESDNKHRKEQKLTTSTHIYKQIRFLTWKITNVKSSIRNYAGNS